MVRCNLVLKSFIAIYLIFVFFYLDISIAGSNKKKGGTAGGSSSSKKKIENTDVSPRKNQRLLMMYRGLLVYRRLLLSQNNEYIVWLHDFENNRSNESMILCLSRIN